MTVNATTVDAIRAVINDMPSGMSIRPSMPSRKKRGRKLATIIKVELRIGKRTSREASNTTSLEVRRSSSGSWAFIFSFIAIMVIWMVLNIVLKDKAFDAYPFILLNLVLSCIAAVQAPLIMMSQNRQEAKDRERAENDFKVNLKSELIIDDLHRKMDLVLENQKKINRRLDLLEQAENISPEQKKNIVSSSKKTLPQDNDSLA